MVRYLKGERKTLARDYFRRNMQRLEIAADDSEALLRLERSLHRWHELECGTDRGGVERDETTSKTYWYDSRTGRRAPCRDAETPALKRLVKVMARYPHLGAYVQTDPRGCAIYVYRLEDLKARNAAIETCYSSIGVAIGIFP